jgi:hypothetical protein
VDLAAYDSARAPMAVARQWLDAVARKDMSRVRDLSQFPLTLRGLLDRSEPAALVACGGRVEKHDGFPDSFLEIAAAGGFDKAIPCLREPTMNSFTTPPALEDGVWPANRRLWFAGYVGTTLPTTLKTLPRDLRRFSAELKPLFPGAMPVQAVLTDNAGFTNSFVIVLVPAEAGQWRGRAVFADERFDE